MPAPWDDKADKDLLLAIIDEGTLKSFAWPAISDRMTSKGYNFTGEACRQHYQKIRKQSGANGTPRAPASTPRKRSKASNATKGKDKNNIYAEHEDGMNDQDDEEDFETPTKKRFKKEKKEESDQENNPFDQNGPFFKAEAGEIIDLEEDKYASIPLF